MYKVSGELTVILITIWWLQNLGKDWQCKQAAQRFDWDRFNLRKLNELDVRECLLSFGAESFVFQFAIQKFKD